MGTILWILAAFAALMALYWLAYWTALRRIHPHLPPDERFFVETPDGWRLELDLVRSTAGTSRASVLCLPGLACNAVIFDLVGERSLARFLASKGYDVWLLNCRGAGRSDHADNKKRLFTYALEEYAFMDACAAARFVREKTGKPLYLLGHSMGGLIAELTAQKLTANEIAGIICVASPFDFSPHQASLGPYYRLLKFVVSHRINAPLGPLSRLFGPFYAPFWPGSLIVYNRAVESWAMRRMLTDTVETPTPKMFGEFYDAISQKTSLAAFLAEPLHFSQPVFALWGDFDRLAPKDSVFPLQASLPQIEFAGVGPFGHIDILVGKNAPSAIYPLIADWLNRQTSTESAPATPEVATEEALS